MYLIRPTKNCNRCRAAYVHRLRKIECFCKQHLAPYGCRCKTTLALTTTEVHGIPNEQSKRNILRATITFRRRKSLACGVCALQLFHNPCTAWVLQCCRKRFPRWWYWCTHRTIFLPFSKCNNLEAVEMLAKWKTWLVEIARVATNAQPHSRYVLIYGERRAGAQSTHTLTIRHTGQCNNSSGARATRYSKSFLSLLCLRCHIATQGRI